MSSPILFSEIPKIVNVSRITDNGSEYLKQVSTVEMMISNLIHCALQSSFSPDGSYLLTTGSEPQNKVRVLQLNIYGQSTLMYYRTTKDEEECSSNQLVSADTNTTIPIGETIYGT